jgi:hypothetical protein
MVPPAAAMHMKNIAAATAPGAGHEKRNARHRICCGLRQEANAALTRGVRRRKQLRHTDLRGRFKFTGVSWFQSETGNLQWYQVCNGGASS